VTLQLLWEEHRAAHHNGYGYSRFCDLYRAWEARLSPTMRQTHVAGERLFVDLRIPAPVAQMRHRTG
jgi:transposase